MCNCFVDHEDVSACWNGGVSAVEDGAGGGCAGCTLGDDLRDMAVDVEGVAAGVVVVGDFDDAVGVAEDDGVAVDAVDCGVGDV